MGDSRWLPTVARIQGIFYLGTGVWSLIDIDSFQAVTGPKTDLWLVRTVGVLVAVIGTVILMAARQHRLDQNVMLLAVGTALGLAAIDIGYVVSGTISPVYLGDAVVELGLAGLWGIGRLRR